MGGALCYAPNVARYPNRDRGDRFALPVCVLVCLLGDSCRLRHPEWDVIAQRDVQCQWSAAVCHEVGISPAALFFSPQAGCVPPWD